MILAASVLLAVVPLVAQPFFDLSVDALDDIEAGAVVGSLIGVLFLIAIPILMLGTCSPWAIRLAVPDVEHAGRVAGRLYAISTVGSLLGTLVSALVLIPFIGTQRTFLVFAAAIALIAAAGLGWRFIAVPVALAAAIALPVGTVKATNDGEVIFETETENQYVRVVEEDDGDRLLELNEGQAVHSLYRPGSYLTGNVWDGYLVLPFTGLDAPPERIAILGNAAGTTARAYGHYFPETEIDGVEIDPELEEVGRTYFDMGSAERLTVHNEDARPWLRRSDGGYDVIMVDAYRQPYIPFYLATKEFFELVRDRLAPGGLVALNVATVPGDRRLEDGLAGTLATVFPIVRTWPALRFNHIVIGFTDDGSEVPHDPAVVPVELVELLQRDLGPPVEPKDDPWSDDHAPVEWVTDRMILSYAAEGGRLDEDQLPTAP
jgi:spermidine synthase